MNLTYRVHTRTSAGHKFYYDYKTREAARHAIERIFEANEFDGLSAYESRQWIRRNGMLFEFYTNYVPSYQL